MSIGIGKSYWVSVMKHFYGTLEECIQFMLNNKARGKNGLYELRPVLDPKKDTCEEYHCIYYEC